MWRKLIIAYALIFMSAVIPLPCAGDEETKSVGVMEISLEKAIDMAVRESEDVEIMGNEMAKTDYLYKEAFSSLYPHFNADVKYNYYPSVQKVHVDLGIPSVPPQDVKLQEDFDLGIGVKMEQVIYTFGRIRNAVMAADNARKASRYGKESAEREISYGTAVSYIAALLAQKTIGIVQNSYDNAVENRRILDNRYEFGRVPKADNIKASADVAIRVPSLKKAESALDLSMRSLKVLTGVDEGTEVRLTDDLLKSFPDYETDAAISSMMEVEPTLKALAKNIELNSNIMALQRAEHYPTINGFASYTYFGQSDKAYIGWGSMQHLGTIGLILNIPIWNGNAEYAVYKQAEVDKKNSELNYKKALKRFTLELRNAISEYRSLLVTYRANVESEKLSEQSFEAAQESFRAGRVSLTDLNDAELQLTRCKLSTVLTLHDINLGVAKIEKLISGEGKRSWKERIQG